MCKGQERRAGLWEGMRKTAAVGRLGERKMFVWWMEYCDQSKRGVWPCRVHWRGGGTVGGKNLRVSWGGSRIVEEEF